MKRKFYITVAFIAPFLLMLLTSTLTQQLMQNLSTPIFRVGISFCTGVLLAVLIFYILRRSIQNLRLNEILWGSAQSIAWGFGIGLAVSVSSGLGFGFYQGYQFDLNKLFDNLYLNFFASAAPAFNEELIFRGGIVHITGELFGISAGLLSGSIPFGLLHFIGVFFGQTVTPEQILGITFAGLMLTLMYYKFGIFGAFTCHLTWNTLVDGWAKAYGAANRAETVSALEGSWITCLVLLLTCFALAYSLFFASDSHRK